MTTTFLRSNNAESIEERLEQLNNGYSVLYSIANGTFTNKELIEYTKSLVGEVNLKKKDIYFWTIGDTDNMPSDARVDFIYKPTYIASSIIMYSILKNPELLSDETIKETLMKGLNGCIGRDFGGHGYEFEQGLIETMEIFSILDTYDFIVKYPNLNPKFTSRFYTAITEINALSNQKPEEISWVGFDRDKAIKLKEYYNNKMFS